MLPVTAQEPGAYSTVAVAVGRLTGGGMLTLDERSWRKAAMGLLLANQKPRYETSGVSELWSRVSPATSTTCHFSDIL